MHNRVIGNLAGLCFLILLGIAVYFLYKTIPGVGRRFRIAVLVWHILGTATVLAMYLGMRHMSDSIFKEILIAAASFYIVEILMHLPVLAVWGAVCGVCRLTGKTENRLYRFFRDRKIFLSVCLLVIVIIFCLGADNMNRLVYRDYEYTLDKTAAVEELNLVVVADLHVGAGTGKAQMEQLTERIADASPDLILIVGDVFDETTSADDIARFIACFRQLSPTYGCFYSFGNHDYARRDELRGAMSEAGIRVLANESVYLPEAGVTLVGRGDEDYGLTDIRELFARDSVDTTHPVIVMQHIPKNLSELADTGADFVFCGHTHGEILPFTNITRYLFTHMNPIEGEGRFGDVVAVTTTGVSNWGWRCKFPSKNEILRVKLHFNAEKADG